ncbi:MAG: LacI family DNA-binding transcriptional regulator [bacterium]|nr:LacI family DNA-binding transcriptional regulator [bacterium]
MKKPTTKDVADLAGVSQATVSMILNNKKTELLCILRYFQKSSTLRACPVFGK